MKNWNWGWLGSIRSLTAFIIVGTFSYMAIAGKIEAKDVVMILGVVLAFYFTKDRSKPEREAK